jgi:transcriptional regulatory protein LevR
MRQAQTFLATIGTDDPGMKTLAVISILALLAISGAAYTDQLLTNDQQAAQRVN